uniref:Cd79a protein n=1 Tax=Ceratias holboelli TaxID=206108 RepID=A0A7S8ZWG5_9TELE|nr:Cd79a protein [Ceratias holboelli]
MWTAPNFLLFSYVVARAQREVNLKADRPYLRVPLSGSATLECCYTTNVESLELTWVMRVHARNTSLGPKNVTSSVLVTTGDRRESDAICRTLSLPSVQLNDSGLYQCFLKSNDIRLFSHGTYMQVYKPLEKTINLSEDTKNKILTAEGILLLLCVLLPATSLLYQSKRLNEVKRKKVMKEEENIYQGLHLDDSCATYDQIEHSQAHGLYQDVCNVVEEEEEIRLEKP